MSLGYVWVKCADGKFYRDLTFRGPDWFVCFDEDEPEEIVVKAPNRAPVREPATLLREMRFEFKRLSRPTFSGRVFDKGSWKFHDACSWYFSASRIPAPTRETARWEKVVDSIGKVGGSCTIIMPKETPQ